MERSSYFIKDKALFGGYPTQESVNIFEENGVRHFIDLTCPGERKITPYKTKYTYHKYCIRDHRVPTDWHSFAQFILKICNIIKKLNTGEKIYIHCKGGHGRSGIVVASVLCHLYKIQPVEALRLTKEYHSRRKKMKDYRRQMGSPPGENQKEFVRRFFRPLYFYKAYSNGATAGFSNFSIHSVEIKDFGIFPTAEAAINAYKDPDNKDYVRKQETAFNPHVSKKLGRTCKLRKDWDEVKDQLMYKVLNAKFHQHTDIRESLLRTGLQPLIQHSPDMYWGDGRNGRGRNMLGKILVRLRNKMHIKED